MIFYDFKKIFIEFVATWQLASLSLWYWRGLKNSPGEKEVL